MSPGDRRQSVRYCCLGLDLGKQTDYSALAMLKWDAWPPSPPPGPVYEVPTLFRWQLGTPYLNIVADLAKWLKTSPVPGVANPLLVVDATGVGEAVFEMVVTELIRANVANCSFVGVTITAGSAVTLAGEGRWRVAKKQLVSVLQVLLGHRRLQVAAALPEARGVQRELETFSVKITDSGNETFESWRERDHDDLVLAVALASWAAESLDVFRPPQDEGPTVVRV